MDEKLRDLVGIMLAERFGHAFLAMKEENLIDADAIEHLVDLSDLIEHHPDISDDAKKVVQEFLSLDADNNARFQKYLYIQGAKDCVAVFWELDLIKSTNGGR